MRTDILKRPPIYGEVMEYMNEWYPFMVTYVLKMGYPVDDLTIDLACVEWTTKSDGRPLFHLNSPVVETLNDEERCFIFLHETFHVMLNHNRLPFSDLKKSNIAADIVINDILVHRGMKKFPGLLYGEETIGFDSYSMTVKEVYDLLPDPDDMPQPSGDGSTALEQAMQSNGSCGEEHQFDDLTLPDSLKEMVPAELISAAKETSESGKSLAGKGHTDLEEWASDQKVELRWAQILDKLNPTIFKGSGVGKRRMTFNRLNRKVAWAAPEIVLPVYRDTPEKGLDEGRVPSVALAIDTSTSISKQTKERFIRIAQSIPRDFIDLKCISFTTVVNEFDLDYPSFHRGGTDFQCIEDWVQKAFPKYPDAVIVFTDGEAYFNQVPQNIGRWYWFICDREHDLVNVKHISACWEKIEEFVK